MLKKSSSQKELSSNQQPSMSISQLALYRVATETTMDSSKKMRFNSAVLSTKTSSFTI